MDPARRSRARLRPLAIGSEAAKPPSIEELRIADPPEAWADLGFAVADRTCSIGRIRVRLLGPEAGKGIVGWSLRGIGDGKLDGLPTEHSDGPLPEPGSHPNGAISIDHVVAFTPDLERTLPTLESAGLDLRRIREGEAAGRPVRQAFFRLAEALLELVGPPEGEAGEGPARFWGLVVVVEDLDACAGLLGERLGRVKDAVQPGRRIATVRAAAGLSVPLALMTSDPKSAGRAPG